MFENQNMDEERLCNIKLHPNYSLFVIPSWSDLLGYPTLGTYAHHEVSRIDTDIVIFFSTYDYAIHTETGTLYFLFGLGYFYVKFELDAGNYVTDNRLLTGLVIPDFVYDHMATSPNITLEDDLDVIVAEKAIKVPINLSYKSKQRLTFIKGALMRNLFTPNKEIILEMMEKIRDPNTYQIDKTSYMLLSAHWDFFNEILISAHISEELKKGYTNSVASINAINAKADDLLKDTISSTNLNTVKESIMQHKRLYSRLEYDPMYLFSLVENAPDFSTLNSSHNSSKVSKHSLFNSANTYADSYINWSEEFIRKEKPKRLVEYKQPEKLAEIPQTPMQVPEDVRIEPPEPKEETFQLDRLKSEFVEEKELPNPPIANVILILLYLKQVIDENYDMVSLGRAFEVARDTMRKLDISSTVTQQAKIWEMSKYANLFLKKEPKLSLPLKEKQELNLKLDNWLEEIEKEEQIERERLEKCKRKWKEKTKSKAEHAEEERIDMEKSALKKQKEELKKLRRERKKKEKLAKQKIKAQKKIEKQRKKIEKLKRKEQERLKKL